MTAERKAIIALSSIIVAAVLGGAGFFGYTKYEAAQLEKARVAAVEKAAEEAKRAEEKRRSDEAIASAKAEAARASAQAAKAVADAERARAQAAKAAEEQREQAARAEQERVAAQAARADAERAAAQARADAERAAAQARATPSYKSVYIPSDATYRATANNGRSKIYTTNSNTHPIKNVTVYIHHSEEFRATRNNVNVVVEKMVFAFDCRNSGTTWVNHEWIGLNESGSQIVRYNPASQSWAHTYQMSTFIRNVFQQACGFEPR